MSVITVLIIAAVANIILVAVAIAWKNCERSKPATVSCRIYLQCSLSSPSHPDSQLLSFSGERKKAQLNSVKVGRQATSIAMDTNPAYMTPSGEQTQYTITYIAKYYIIYA